MSRQLTEEKVLKKLNIEDFRHLTKDHAIQLASMLDKMNPEVAKKALEQFPEFSSASKDILATYNVLLEKALDDNAKGVQNYYDVSKSIIETLQKELDKDDLSSDDRRYIIDQMLEVHDRMGMKDSEDKQFRAFISKIGLGALFVVGSGLVVALGGKSIISKE